MALTLDIVETYRSPSRALSRRLNISRAGREEAQALMTLMLACGLLFVAQWPPLSRLAFESDQDLRMLLGGALMGWLFVAPLAFYGIAALSHLVARLVGGQGTWFGARMALFWALLATAPLWLLNGLVAGFIGPGPALNVVGTLAFAAFGIIWITGLYSVERPA